MAQRRYITQKEYAAHRKISPQAINKWVKRGIVKLYDGKVDWKKADKAIEAYANPAHDRGGKRGAVERMTFAQARTQHERYRAALAKLDFEEKDGQKVDVEAVKKAAFETGRRIREAVKNIAPRIESILAAEPDVARVRAILDREHDAVLADLADEFAATG
jgi:phage terminase Nu1 subunit (DNA packaging protein)